MKLLKSLQVLGLSCLLAGIVWMQLIPAESEVREAHKSAAWLLIFGGSAWFALSRFMLWIVRD